MVDLHRQKTVATAMQTLSQLGVLDPKFHRPFPGRKTDTPCLHRTSAPMTPKLNDILKLAKLIALNQGDQAISLLTVRQALSAYVDNRRLDDAAAAHFGLDAKGRKTPDQSDGLALLAQYRSTPRLPISPRLFKLRQRLEGLTLKLPLPDGNSAAERAPAQNRDAFPAPTQTPQLTAGPGPAEAKTEAGMENAAPAAHQASHAHWFASAHPAPARLCLRTRSRTLMTAAA